MKFLALFVTLLVVLCLVDATRNLRAKKDFLSTDLARCATKPATDAQHTAFLQKVASLPVADSAMRSFATVLVYFHVIMTSDGHGVVSDQQINDQMQVLRNAFKGVNFNLQNVQRVTNDDWFSAAAEDPAENAMNAALRQGGFNALNVYTRDGSAEKALGWTYMPQAYTDLPSPPPYDAIQLDFRTLPGGAYTHYNLGDTLVHEAGHWMGLDHTFAGGCAYLGRMGDRVRDTPAVKEANYGCKPKSTNSCPGTTKGYKGNDLVRNYMDYGYDECTDSFTPGQVARMTDVWRAIRKPQ